MALTRRANALAAAPGAARERSGSTIWEDEANQYWQAMEPAGKQRGRSSLLRFLVVVAAVCGVGGGFAVSFGAGTGAWLQWSSSLLSIGTKASAVERSPTNATDTQPSPVQTSPNPVKMVDQPAMEQLRARCRVRGVQSRWHEETCRKMCLREPQQSACMNGCSYGSITVTKLTCDEVAGSEAYPSTSSRCPDGVNCAGACRAYDREKPFPAMRNACERGCANVVPSACARVLQIFRDLERGAIH